MAVNPFGFTAVVKHSVNTSLVVLNVVVDRIWESARQDTIETEALVVDSGVKGKRRQIALEHSEKVIAKIRAACRS